MRALVIGCVLVLAGIAPAQAQTQEQLDWCVNQPKRFTPDQAIGGCTAAIMSGKWVGKELAWAYNNRCSAFSNSQQYDRAIADCDYAIRLDPNHQDAYYNRGNAFRGKKDYPGAIAAYNEAIRVNPNDASAYANRALTYEDMGDRERAIADFRKALALGDTLAADDLRRLGVTP